VASALPINLTPKPFLIFPNSRVQCGCYKQERERETERERENEERGGTCFSVTSARNGVIFRTKP